MSDRRREWTVRPDPDGPDTDESSERPSVRIFPDYAGGVIWFASRPGPVGYDEARIDGALAERMRAWEAEFDRDFAPDLEWSTPDGEARHLAEGLRLARALSDELGDAFVVEVDDIDDAGNEVLRRMRGLGPGTNPEAVAVFEGWWGHQQAEAARWRADGADGSFVPARSIPLAARDRDERHSH